ncbi:MAG TPA: hypothetical protein VJU87_12415 [Gemmatimonadaceae bacterium]|nr:hypothetical protein [Gemmatimonadaceae bacterium]
MTDSADWRRADYPAAQGRGNISYRVLASIGSRFLVATEMWGGGSGEFSNLFWIRLGDRQIAIERDLAGGDRCAGGPSNYTVDRSSVRFDVSTTAQDIITLTGVALSDSVRDRLPSAYAACDGEAAYRYDLATGTKRLSSLTLDADIAATGSSESSGSAGSTQDPQLCFDALVRRYVAQDRRVLSPAELQAFGRAFVTRCARYAGA